MAAEAFVDRVFQRIPRIAPREYTFLHWNHGGRPTDEGLGLLPAPGVDVDKIVAAVQDLDHYKGNIDHVAECRAIADARFSPPARIRFYQRLEIPVLGTLQHELVMERLPARNGYEILAWDLLGPETSALSNARGARSDYSMGAWLVGNGVVGYALASAPRRDDVGFLKFKALTSGADAAASRVVRANIEGMIRWASRR
jgi:hypothetical protein